MCPAHTNIHTCTHTNIHTCTYKDSLVHTHSLKRNVVYKKWTLCRDPGRTHYCNRAIKRKLKKYEREREREIQHLGLMEGEGGWSRDG